MKRVVLLIFLGVSLLLTQSNCGLAVRKARESGEVSGVHTNAQTGTNVAIEASLKLRRGLQPGQVWTNSLGMEFVPVPGTEVLFCRWETRVQDFEAFVTNTAYDATRGMYSLKKGNWGQLGDTWRNPGFAQDGTHPVVGVNWGDAQAFCKWLTRKERDAGRLSPKQEYRLPRDWEWSVAVGLNEDVNSTPKDKEAASKGVYPWGREWPPPKDAGNYAGGEAKEEGWRLVPIEGFRDNYPRTAPVGSSMANGLGIHDLGGNVWEWCEDKLAGGRVLRGGSWHENSQGELLSAYRNHFDPVVRLADYGFRIVAAVPVEDEAPEPDSKDTHLADGVAGAPHTKPPRAPQPEQAWTNGIGMEFVPVTGTEVLFCKWETRVKDFDAFVKETSYDATADVYTLRKGKWGRNGDTWKDPGFAQDTSHPVVGVSWDDAKAFCKWLTEKERKEGRLKAGQEYRLPRDREWSLAVGIEKEKPAALKDKKKGKGKVSAPKDVTAMPDAVKSEVRDTNGTAEVVSGVATDKVDAPKGLEGLPKGDEVKVDDPYPWGLEWPPPNGAGNYAGIEAKDDDWTWAPVEGFRDDYPRTAPVGSFKPNKSGIYDLGGNVWEWCEEFYNGKSGTRILRGGSWDNSAPKSMLSARRIEYVPDTRLVSIGFRVVVTVPSH